jgi:hypothetical protein
MKFLGKNNQLVIDIDEAKYLAKKTPSWDGTSLMDAKIAVAKAVLELMNAAKKEPSIGTSIAYDKNVEL